MSGLTSATGTMFFTDSHESSICAQNRNVNAPTSPRTFKRWASGIDDVTEVTVQLCKSSKFRFLSPAANLILIHLNDLMRQRKFILTLPKPVALFLFIWPSFPFLISSHPVFILQWRVFVALEHFFSVKTGEQEQQIGNMDKKTINLSKWNQKRFLLRFVETEAGEVVYNCFCIYIKQLFTLFHIAMSLLLWDAEGFTSCGNTVYQKKTRTSHSGKFRLDHKW